MYRPASGARTFRSALSTVCRDKVLFRIGSFRRTSQSDRLSRPEGADQYRPAQQHGHYIAVLRAALAGLPNQMVAAVVRQYYARLRAN